MGRFNIYPSRYVGNVFGLNTIIGGAIVVNIIGTKLQTFTTKSFITIYPLCTIPETCECVFRVMTIGSINIRLNQIIGFKNQLKLEGSMLCLCRNPTFGRV